MKHYVLVMYGPGGRRPTVIADYEMNAADVKERRRLGSESMRALKAGQTVITSTDKTNIDTIRFALSHQL